MLNKMKYARLTKEQLEELHTEFITFLATQSITAEEWDHIKEKKPEVAEQEIDVFSDLIWEGVLNKAGYLQNSSPQQLFLFKLAEKEIQLILVKLSNSDVDLTTQEGFKWLQSNLKSDDVEFYTAAKPYSEDKNGDIFSLIKEGAEITDGNLYEAFLELL